MNALALLAAALLLPAPALAHIGDGLHHGLMAGFLHPFGGADHLLAMVMVGLWAGLSGGKARLALPGAFLHLYGKDDPRRGRKMGHVTFVAPTLAEAQEQLRAACAILGGAA